MKIIKSEILYAGIQAAKDILIQCGCCGETSIIESSELLCEEWYNNGRMGQRKEYEFSADCECRICHNTISFTQRISEYPLGSIEYIDRAECFGGVLVSGPEYVFPVEDDEIYISYDSKPVSSVAVNNLIPLGNQILGIDIFDGDGYVNDEELHSSKIWVNPARRLLPILVDETGSIRFDENLAVFSEIIYSNPYVATMRLMGKVAEAVMVRNCLEDSRVNRLWLSKARKIRTIQRVADEYRAIGTGLLSTKKGYPQKYSPSNPQRDIIWINEYGEYAGVPSDRFTAAVPAGLQVKVSGNGVNYFLNAMKVQKYEVPLVYFPMNNDYDQVIERLLKYQTIDIIAPGVNFIDVREVDDNAYWEIKDYYPILMGLFSGQLSADEFVREASSINPLRNSIIAGVLSNPKTDIRILH